MTCVFVLTKNTFLHFKQMLRQGANSAVRFSSYSTLKQLAQGSAVPGEDMPGWMTFGIGATAGVITVCKS